jgi:hypothetical protein
MFMGATLLCCYMQQAKELAYVDLSTSHYRPLIRAEAVDSSIWCYETYVVSCTRCCASTAPDTPAMQSVGPVEAEEECLAGDRHFFGHGCAVSLDAAVR